jgi:ketosteroid isomerase-like protein
MSHRDIRDDILALGSRWATAEAHGDAAALNHLAHSDFRLVGPFGFVLDKAQWLDRYRTGALAMASLGWDDVDVRDFGETAIAIGRQVQVGTHEGRRADGEFRVTHVFVRGGRSWLLASMHLSLAAPPAPPTAARSSSD